MSAAIKICCVTNGSVSHAPRVLKEAEALSQAGYDVTVLSAHHFSWTVPLDDEIQRRSTFRIRSLEYHSSGVVPNLVKYFMVSRVGLFRFFAKITLRCGVAELVYSRALLEQFAMAVKVKANLYIGHNLQSLPVVAAAAAVTHAKYAFDAEDLHCGEYEQAEEDDLYPRISRYLQKTYLPGCAYITASSPGIASELVRRYKVSRPSVILNTFPLENVLPSEKEKRSPATEMVSFYWYSQTVSLDRGLQDAVAAIGMVRPKAVLHIRGFLDDDTEAELKAIARANNGLQRLFFHALVPPGELLRCAAQHDVGLCLETSNTVNRDLCITNKVFLYLNAGLAVVGSDTTGQNYILRQISGAGYIYKQGDIPELAKIMSRFAADRELLCRSKKCALQYAKTRWNWGVDRKRLISTVSNVLDTKR